MRIEQSLDSRDVAKMVGKQHKNLLADVRAYIEELGELKIQPTGFFRESTYQSSQNKTMPCYHITKKGCEFIAHKLTGTKGTEFTARYINRFHDMEEELQEKPVPAPVQQESTIESLASALIEANKLLQEKDRKLVEKENEILQLQQKEMIGRVRNHAESYRVLIKDYIEKIKDPKRLATIYTIVLNCYRSEVGIRKKSILKERRFPESDVL